MVAGVGLALSGGGYRAMLFHCGALIRLNEAGLLPKLTRISSVSGGSITAGVLALAWNELGFAGGVATRFGTVVDRVRSLADRTIDVGAVISGLLLPGTIGRRVAAAYDRVLFHGATLQDLPDEADGAPRFVINATSLQTGDLWRFSRPYMGDYRVGLFGSPLVRLCDAVAASSAFPPVLSPVMLTIGEPVEPTEGADLGRRALHDAGGAGRWRDLRQSGAGDAEGVRDAAGQRWRGRRSRRWRGRSMIGCASRRGSWT